MMKLRVLSFPSPPGYMKFTILISFSWIKRTMSSLVNSEDGFCKNATTSLAFIKSSLFAMFDVFFS